ncbi:MAG: xanthine dehydrogenase family protein subunit M [Candidatus Muirbacterium halophilum]|nr:xanthine dehydrogenase family protein subunit M [Candidatus Muirbacterium halophilum]MCK9474381.1 xanthine dehydrogenase family protein subunit M [Candidatus Muirbacterium halophilum]
MIEKEFEFYKAEGYTDVFNYMKKNYLPFAGGTDVMIKVKEGYLRTSGLLYIGDMLELKGIEKKDNSIFIGAAEKLTDIIKNTIVKENFPGLIQAIELIGSLQIRNQATLGGNLANCSPVSDSMPILMALDAKIHIVSENNRKIIELKDFPKGVCQTALETGEIIEKLEIPIINSKNYQAYRKFAQRPEVSIQKCSTAVVFEYENDEITIKKAKIAIGAVAVRALRCEKAEQMLKGQKLSPELIEKVANMVSEESKPISDIRSTREYRQKMVGEGFREIALKSV